MILEQYNRVEIEPDECEVNDYYFSSCKASGGKTVSVSIKIYSDSIAVILMVFDKNSNILLYSYNKIKGNSVKDVCSKVFCMEIEDGGALYAINQLFERISYENYVIFYRISMISFNPVKKERLSVKVKKN